jgi:ABC-2 type transport system permease protein
MNGKIKLITTEGRLYLREPVLVFFTLAFPAILVAILGCIPAFREPDKALGGGRVIDVYVTISITLTIAMLALQATPGIVAGYREKGILRRMGTTPVHPAMLLIAQLVTSLIVVVVSVALIMGLGRIAFAVPLPKQFLGFVVALLLVAAALLAIGLFIAALAPNAKAGNAIGVLLFFPVMFFAGLWVPREVMPAVLRRIADFTPLGAGERALHDATMGSWPHAGSLAVLAVYLVAFGFAAARLFRWQ